MSISWGPQVNNNGLISLLAANNGKCILSPTSLKFVQNNSVQFTIPSGLYDDTEKSFITDGVDEVLNIQQNDTNRFGWGTTISILCKPTPESYVFNNNQSMMLYFTTNKKMTFFAAPTNYSWRYITLVGIEDDNTIILGGGGSNNGAVIFGFDSNANPTNSVRITDSIVYLYSYAFGGIQKISGNYYYATYNSINNKTDMFVEQNTRIAFSVLTYQGDFDLDDDYYYMAGGYRHTAYKVKKSDKTFLSFGDNTVGSDTTHAQNPYGIAAGTNYIFLTDHGNHRVILLDKTTFLYSSQLGVTGVIGNDSTHFNFPTTCKIYNGQLIIADKANNRLMFYNELTLAYVKSVSLSIQPWYIAVNSSGNMVISDRYNFIVVNVNTGIESVSNRVDQQQTGPMNFYGFRGLYKYGNKIYTATRGNYEYQIDVDDVSDVGTRTVSGVGDSYDITLDATHIYGVAMGNGNVLNKVERANRSNKLSITSPLDALDGNFYSPQGIAENGNYIYLADTNNHRVQLLNKSDLLYNNKFGRYGAGDSTSMSSPYSIIIDNGVIYVGSYGLFSILKYNLSDLSYIGEYNVGARPRKIRIDGDELYIMDTRRILVVNKNTGVLIRNKVYPSGWTAPGIRNTYNIELSTDKVLWADGYKLYVIDKATLEIETEQGPHYISVPSDEVINDELILVDIVFTSDYKIKTIVNGNESTAVSVNPDYDFGMWSDFTFGNFRETFNATELKRFAFYNTERTATDNMNDLNYFKKQP